MPKLSIVIPIYNEEGAIDELYTRLHTSIQQDFPSWAYEIIFVDDGSRDQSFPKLKQLASQDPNIIVIQFSRNFGHHIAVTAGLDQASGDYVVTMDGDLQDQPEELKTLYNKLIQGFDVVAGARIHKKFSLLKRICSRMFVWVIQRLTDKRIIINNTIFRMMTKQVADEIKKMREAHRYLVGIIGWVGFNHTTAPVEHGKRFAGQSKYNLRRQIRLACDAIISFSDRLLQLISLLGLMLVGISCLCILYILYRKILSGIPVLGWASLITTILFIGGIQILILGVLGAYIGRTYMETKRRPLYVVRAIIKK